MAYIPSAIRRWINSWFTESSHAAAIISALGYTPADAASVADALNYKPAVDCSGNPNYPAGNAGDYRKISVAGKIGGASGRDVGAGDVVICNTDGTTAGTQAAKGAFWDYIRLVDTEAEVVAALGYTPENIAHKDLPDGYAGLDSEGYLAGSVSGFAENARSSRSLQCLDFLARPETTKQLDTGNFLEVTKSENFSCVAIDDIGGDPIMGSIFTDGGAWVEGDEVLVRNASNLPIRLRKNSAGSEGLVLWWDIADIATMVLPRGMYILCRYNDDAGRFDVTPLYTPSEMLIVDQITSSKTINADTYDFYQGRTFPIGGDTINIDIIPGGAPDRFTCNFMQTDAGDVTFTDDGGAVINVDSHNALKGVGGFVSVVIYGGNVYLFGQTKTI